ncbi:PREDICTED: uncharacterized protein LOC108766612 [Trachymyrmex cornetzi]|uniref:uncharacterized protein LOC108766612 n=1 Tax=Trachymyrmex cornetzi TaxID=471704 RepID=UPI00084F23BE|nr:PREDICTED: uncharacterized protein LOC108766612 [Trachymyrmex cornetzi]
MGWSVIGVTQINLHHSKGASAVLARSQSVMHTAISLIQEPWVVRGCVRGVAACGKLFKAPTEQRPRACITVKGLDARLLPEVCSRDLTAVEGTAVSSAGDARKLVICSAYFPHGEEVPSLELTRLVDLCQKEGLPLLIGCDANAHHTIWGSTGTNEMGRRLLEYLVTIDLEVLNRGNKPTFCTAGRSEVLDLTLCSRGFVRKVREWKVSDEPSLSDRRQITFKLSDLKVEVKKVRNPKRTDWVSYHRDLRINLRDFPKKYGTAEELELCVDYLQRALIGSYEANCPASTVTNNRGTP